MRAAPDAIGSGDFATQIANQSNDLLTTPTAAVCSACHDGALAQEHMATIGGAKFSVKQADIDTSYETCSLCHGPGGIADVNDVHGVP
jgi:cytochrome c553